MTPTPTSPGPPMDPKWTDELRIYGEGFVGRQDELAALDRAWVDGARIFVLHAEGGAGKTRVVVEWLRRMRGCCCLSDEELKKASDEFRGHAYSLMLLGSYLKTATDHHDIRRRSEVVLLDEDPEHGSHARHMFAAYVKHLGEHSPEVVVLRLLGFFDRAAERQLLDVLRAREGRRDEELADAEAAADGPHPWPLPRGAGEGNLPATTTMNQVIPETPSEDSMRDQVFISYSHRDKKLMEELHTHLKPYLRSGAITPWSDKQIAAGAQWFQEIQTALEKASVAVLLVSPDFFASDFIHEHELGPLLKEAEAGGVRILWVPLRPSAFEETPLAKYQAVSPPNRPLSQMNKADRDEAWVRICKEIKKASAATAGTAGSPPKSPSGAASSSAPSAVGGSALKVWQEKLDYLLEQEAIASDPNQRFQLRKNIEEARQKIRELGGQA